MSLLFFWNCLGRCSCASLSIPSTSPPRRGVVPVGYRGNEVACARIRKYEICDPQAGADFLCGKAGRIVGRTKRIVVVAAARVVLGAIVSWDNFHNKTQAEIA